MLLLFFLRGGDGIAETFTHKDIKNQRIGQINRMISLAQITNNQNVELDPETFSQPYRL